MISRRTTLVLAEAYCKRFVSSSNSVDVPRLRKDEFYDYLFGRDYEAWFCNLASVPAFARDFKNFILRLHTGESLVGNTQDGDWEKRKLLGQTYLRYLAKDLLVWIGDQTHSYALQKYANIAHDLVKDLELDGYVFRDGELLYSEADVLNVREELGILQQLHKDLKLADAEMAFDFLKLSEEHYKQDRWSDCIGNARKFFESVLRSIALAYSTRYLSKPLGENVLNRPVDVRDFLMNEKLLEKKEREALDKVYGLLSHTGSHPYMAEKDQARLLRQLSLTFAQFVMLRYEGRSKSA